VEPLIEIIHTFDHLSIQLALVGFKVKVLKVQTLKFIIDLSKHKFFLGLHFGPKWFTHFECANGFLGLCHAFFG
jgi:hypothetical protein